MERINDISLTLLQALVNAGAEFEDEDLAVQIISETLSKEFSNSKCGICKALQSE